jgi:hypothetical protein
VGEFKSVDERRTVMQRVRQRNSPDVYQAVLLGPCGAASLIGGEPDAGAVSCPPFYFAKVAPALSGSKNNVMKHE